MSFHTLIPAIKQVEQILLSAHKAKGTTVLMQRGGSIWNNPSAKSILNAWHYPNPTIQNIVQYNLLEVCGNGDGAKTACLLSTGLLKSFARMYESPHPTYTNQVDRAVLEAIKDIKPLPSSESVLVEIGMESSLDRESVEKVAEALNLSGGLATHITLEKGIGVGCEVIESEALHSSVRIHTDKEAYLKGPMFALSSQPLKDLNQVVPIMELMGGFEGRPLVLVAPFISGQALKTIQLNRHKGVLDCHAVEAPRVIWGMGWMEDFAAFTGGHVHQPNLDGEFKAEFFGSAFECVLNFTEMITYPYDDHAEKTAERAELLLREAQESPHTHTQDLWRQRANALTGSLIRLKVGGHTEAEGRVRRVQTEKALLSMSDALKNGYVEGALPTLYKIETSSPTLNEALKEPLRVVARNADLTEDQLLSRDELYQPFPAGRLASILRKSISVATSLASVEVIISRGT